MRIFVCSLMMAAVFGCSMKDDPKPAVAEKSDEQQTDNQPKGRSPGGMAGLVLPGDDDVRGAGNGGQNQTPQPAPPQPNPGNAGKAIPEDQARFLEWPKAKQDRPGLEVVDDTPQGGDYLTFLGSAFVTLRSRPQVLNFQHQLDIMAAGNEGGNPVSLKEYQDLARQLKIDFNKQPAYRYYGYNTKTGKLVMLEDKIEKKRIYEEKGIPYED
jgi:hypothetical protein